MSQCILTKGYRLLGNIVMFSMGNCINCRAVLKDLSRKHKYSRLSEQVKGAIWCEIVFLLFEVAKSYR